MEGRPTISVIAPIQTAWSHMVRVLFEPFDFTKWLIMGFACFLADLVSYFPSSGGGGGNSSDYSNSQTSGLAAPHPLLASCQESFFALNRFIENPMDFLSNFSLPFEGAIAGLFIVITILVVIFLLLLGITMLWVSCHGIFIFIDNVSRNEARIFIPWKKYSPQAWSLFWFYLALWFLIFLGIIFCSVIVLGLILTLEPTNEIFSILTLLGLSFGVIILILLGAFGIKSILIPRMFIKQCSAREALKESWALCCEAPGHWLLFVLIYLGLWIVIIFVFLICCLFTCCIAVLPYVHHVLFLPVYVFMQSYILSFIAQFGSEWDAFSASRAVPPLSSNNES